MSKLAKLYARMKNNPKTVRFNEVEKILEQSGFVGSFPGGGSSHKTFRHPSGLILTVPFRQPYVLEVYVKRAIELIDSMGGI